MALVEILPGDEADANVLMANFDYLNNRIISTNESISTVQSNLQSLNTTLK